MLGFALRRLSGVFAASILLMCWLPAGAAAAGVGSLTGTGLPALSLAVAICGAAYVLLGYRLRSLLGVHPGKQFENRGRVTPGAA